MNGPDRRPVGVFCPLAGRLIGRAAGRRAFLAYNLSSEAFLGSVPGLYWTRKASMPSYTSPRACLPFEQALAPFLADEGLPFAKVLPAETVERAFAEEGVHFG